MVAGRITYRIWGRAVPSRPPKAHLVSALVGDSPKQIAPSNIGDVDTDPTWTPDGKSIIFTRAPAGEQRGQAIYRVDLSSGNLTLILGSNSLCSPRISPDGRYIAVFKHCGRETVDASGSDHQLMVNVGGRGSLRLQPVVARREIRLRAGKRGRV